MELYNNKEPVAEKLIVVICCTGEHSCKPNKDKITLKGESCKEIPNTIKARQQCTSQLGGTWYVCGGVGSSCGPGGCTCAGGSCHTRN